MRREQRIVLIAFGLQLLAQGAGLRIVIVMQLLHGSLLLLGQLTVALVAHPVIVAPVVVGPGRVAGEGQRGKGNEGEVRYGSVSWHFLLCGFLGIASSMPV